MVIQTPRTTAARLFVAVVPPPAAVVHLGEAVARAGIDGLRATPVDQWHLTLAFMPSVAEPLVPAIGDALARAAAAAVRGGVDLRLRGAGRFGDRVVWVGVAGATAELTDLATAVRTALVGSGAEPEDRPFRPHLTVARGSNGDRAAVRAVVERLEDYEGPPWTVAELRLIRSRPGLSGAVHETLVRCPLG